MQKLLKIPFRIPFQDRFPTEVSVSHVCYYRLKNTSKLIGTSAEAEEFSYIFIFFLTYFDLQFDYTMYSLILHNTHKSQLTDIKVNKKNWETGYCDLTLFLTID